MTNITNGNWQKKKNSGSERKKITKTLSIVGISVQVRSTNIKKTSRTR